MKKLVTLFLALCLMVSACSFAAASGDNVTITVYRDMFNTIPEQSRVQAVEDAINARLAGRGYQIKMVVLNSGEYGDKANLALAAKEINLLWTASWMSVIGTNDLIPLNAVYDITDLLEGSALYSSMDAGQWEASKYNGRNYFVPVYKDNVEGYDLSYRLDLAEQFGWDFSNVTTLADIEPMLEDAVSIGIRYPYLTQKTNLFHRWYLDSFDFFTADATTNFIAIDRSTNTVVDTVLTPEYAEFCKLMGRWGELGYLSEDDANKVTTDTTTHTQDWAISYWTDVPNNSEISIRYEQPCAVKAITKRWSHSTSNLGSCYCVTANSTPEQAAACVDFLGLIYTDASMADLFTYGVEGTDFVYNAEGQVTRLTGDEWSMDMWSSVSATILTPLEGYPTNTAELYKEFNSGAEVSCAAGFRFDKTPVNAQFAACQSVHAEYGFALENGVVSPDDVDAEIEAYQAALDAAGYQDILAEFSAQYEAWKASK